MVPLLQVLLAHTGLRMARTSKMNNRILQVIGTLPPTVVELLQIYLSYRRYLYCLTPDVIMAFSFRDFCILDNDDVSFVGYPQRYRKFYC